MILAEQDQQWRVVSVCQLFLEWAGQTAADWVGTPLDGLLADCPEALKPTFQERFPLSSGVTWNGVVTLQRPDGSSLPTHMAWAPLSPQPGQAAQAVATFYPLSEPVSSKPRHGIESQLRRILDSNIIGILFSDIHGHILEANDAFLNLIGYTRAEMQTSQISWLDLTPPECAPAESRAAVELMNTGSCKPYEKQYIHKQGHRIDVLVGFTFLEGSREQVVCIVLDITQQKQMERALKEQEEQYRLLQSATNDAIWYWDLRTQQLQWNGSLYTLFQHGVDQQTASIAWWEEQIHPEDRGEVLASLQEVLENRNPLWTAQYRFRCGDESYATVIDRGYVVFDPDTQEPIRMIGSMMDITQQVATQQSLKSSLNRERLIRRINDITNQTFDLRQIVNAVAREIALFFRVDRCLINTIDSAQGVTQPRLFDQYCCDPSIRPVNTRDIPLTGIHPDSVLFQASTLPQLVNLPDVLASLQENQQQFGCYQLLDDSARQALTRYVDHYSLRSLLMYEIHYRGIPFGSISLHQCSGPRFWDAEAVNLLKDIATHLGVAFYQADLFQKEKQSRQLAELANERKSHFFANMSHELRTPLNAIIGYSEMLLSGMAQTPDKQLRYAHNIATSGRHLLNMVNDILDLSKVEAGKLSLSLQPIHLSVFLGEVQGMMQEMARQKQVTLILEPPPAILPAILEADPARLKQIFINLIHNGLKFNHVGGQVTVRLQPSPDHQRLVVTVADTGIGIPAQELDNLFSDFYQVDQTLARQYEGTGLGLSLTKRLVELHGGTISVSSVEGAGSTFQVTLPLTCKEVPQEDSPKTCRSPGE